MSAELASSQPLKFEQDPFAADRAGVHVWPSLQTALREIVRHVVLKTPVVLVTGGAGTGKTAMAGMVARMCAEMGLKILRVDRGDLIHGSLGERPDVLLVDEANCVPDFMWEAQAKGDTGAAGTAIFFGLPGLAERFDGATLKPPVVALTALSESEARTHLLERAGSAGVPHLFDADAQDVIVEGANGSPRVLRSIASLAFFRAASEGASQIGLRHAISAIVAQQIPSEAETPAEPADIERAPVEGQVQNELPEPSETAATPSAETVEEEPSAAVSVATPLLLGEQDAVAEEPAAASVAPFESPQGPSPEDVTVTPDDSLTLDRIGAASMSPARTAQRSRPKRRRGALGRKAAIAACAGIAGATALGGAFLLGSMPQPTTLETQTAAAPFSAAQFTELQPLPAAPVLAAPGGVAAPPPAPLPPEEAEIRRTATRGAIRTREAARRPLSAEEQAAVRRGVRAMDLPDTALKSQLNPY